MNNQTQEALTDEDAPHLAKHAMEYHGLTLRQFVLMCEEAHKRYEGQFSNAVDKQLAVECFYEGFKVACKEALEQPAQIITEGATMFKQVGNSPKPPPPPPMHICTYSRTMNQSYPRKCIHCGKVEALEQPAQDNLSEAIAGIDAEIERCGGAWNELPAQEPMSKTAERDYNFMRDLAIGTENISNEMLSAKPVAHIKQGMDGYPKLVFNGIFQYDSITAKQPDIALYTKEQL